MTNTEIAQRQAEIDARVAAATPGEWEYKETTRGQYAVWAGDVVVMGDYGGSIPPSSSDAEFCANAKSDLIWQRKRIKELKAELEKCQNILASACDGYCPHCWRSGTDSCLQEC